MPSPSWPAARIVRGSSGWGPMIGKESGVAARKPDVLLFGSESAGVPGHVHAAATRRLRIPIRDDARSLNLAIAVAMATGEALRQTGGWPA